MRQPTVPRAVKARSDAATNSFDLRSTRSDSNPITFVNSINSGNIVTSANPAELQVIGSSSGKSKSDSGARKDILPQTVAIQYVERPATTYVARANPNANSRESAGAPVADLAARRKIQTQRYWRQLIKRVVIILTATALAAGAVWLVGFSPYLVLSPDAVEVVAEGDTLVDLTAVQQIPLAHTGLPLIRISPGEIREAVRSEPAVRDAQVHRVWPNGLRIQVESRIPVAAVATPQGLVLIDADGVVLVPVSDRGDLPLFDVPLDNGLIVTGVLAVYHELPEAILRQLRHVSATTMDDISTTLVTGQVVRWGSSEQLKLKVATALALLDTVPNTLFFDVSSPSVPVTR